MLFKSSIVALAVATFLPSAVSALTVTSPSASSYWVANTSNTIYWTYNNGDPNPVSLVVTNENNTFLNGPFSIAEYIQVSSLSFTVTNVTLKVGSGYKVNFVNSTNPGQTYASSDLFEVKPGGTPTANIAAPPSPTGAVASGSASVTGSRTGSAASTASTATASSGALSSRVVSPVGVATFSAMLLGAVGGTITFLL